jgi:hypothetical protein
MKKIILVTTLAFSAALLSSCTVRTPPGGPINDGYSVGYGYDDTQGDFGYNNYVGYGGWTSNYYAPGYRYNVLPGTYYYSGPTYYRR